MTKQTGTVWEMSAGKKNQAELEFYKALGSEGARVMTRMADDEFFREQLVRFAVHDYVLTTTNQQRVLSLMGDGNIFLPRDWTTHYAKFGVKFGEAKLKRAFKFPWDGDMLRSPCPFHRGKTVRETHFIFWGLDRVKHRPLSINRLQEWHPKSDQPIFNSYGPDCWYKNDCFARNVTCQSRWYLMLKEIVPGSLDKPFDEQQAMLPAEYEMPTAVAEVTKCILFGVKNAGYRLNGDVTAGCIDLSSNSCRVRVGNPVSGLWISDWYKDAHYDLGIAASRKLPEKLPE